MKKKIYNAVEICGYLYQHSLTEKLTGPTSKNPNSPYIRGEVQIATDEDLLNVVTVTWGYSAPSSKKAVNDNYNMLKGIIDGKFKTVMDEGKENATKVRVTSSVGVNDFFTEEDGEERLVTYKRNDGGFIHACQPNENNEFKACFDTDMLIMEVKRFEADEERERPERMEIGGYAFTYNGALLPVTYTVYNPDAMSYFEGLDISQKNPTFTRIWGEQISQTVIKTITTENAFGLPKVTQVPQSRKDWVVTGANPETYEWDDESGITAVELKEKQAKRELDLADNKKRSDEWKANRNKASAFAAPATPTVSTTEEYKF